MARGLVRRRPQKKETMRGRPRKKGGAGHVVKYLTRNQCLKRLQVTLAEFRKLCILKAIYPRVPPKKMKGSNKTYYLLEDIQLLANEPLIATFRTYRTHKRKVRRALARHEPAAAESLKQHKPTYQLAHLVKERYPTLVDALRDLDDSLSLMFLFACHQSNVKVHTSRILECTRLSREWQCYVATAHVLRRAFLSIKGVYFQAEIMGQKVTWLQPYSFQVKPEKDVDYKVLCTFLDFSQALLGFVCFKLYTTLGFCYPPTLDVPCDDAGEHMKSLLLQPTSVPSLSSQSSNENPLSTEKSSTEQEEQKNLSEARLGSLNAVMSKMEVFRHASDDVVDVIAHDSVEDETVLDSSDDEVNRSRHLFYGLKFFLSREVPIAVLEFVICSLGGQTSWQGSCAPYEESDQMITHQVVDRDHCGHRFFSREYVQPQWVFDCLNENFLIPVDEYMPGRAPPVHLSPFVVDKETGYVPERRRQLDWFNRSKLGPEVEAESQAETDRTNQQNVTEQMEKIEELEKRYQDELATELDATPSKTKDVKIMPQSKHQRSLNIAARHTQTDKQLAVMMMPNKKRKLYKRMVHGIKRKERVTKRLLRKRENY